MTYYTIIVPLRVWYWLWRDWDTERVERTWRPGDCRELPSVLVYGWLPVFWRKVPLSWCSDWSDVKERPAWRGTFRGQWLVCWWCGRLLIFCLFLLLCHYRLCYSAWLWYPQAPFSDACPCLCEVPAFSLLIPGRTVAVWPTCWRGGDAVEWERTGRTGGERECWPVYCVPGRGSTVWHVFWCQCWRVMEGRLYHSVLIPVTSDAYMMEEVYCS